MSHLVLFAVLLGSGCDGKSGVAPPPAPTPTPKTAVHKCKSADDCGLTNIRSEDDCCGDPCESARPMHRDDLAALEATRIAHCADKVEECPAADCDVPTNYYPGCDNGTCVAIELPRRTECKSDADCELSCYQPKSCCGSCECGTPWNKTDLAAAEKWRSEQCKAADCVEAKCAAPTVVAKCENGWCVGK